MIFAVSMLAAGSAFANPVRYEAQDARLDNAGADQNASVASSPAASGGEYVVMRDGNLFFDINIATAGFYDMWINYSSTYGGSKTQNLSINGTSSGSIVFAETGPANPTFERMLAVSKMNLPAGPNVIGIVSSWGWVDIDYIEVVSHEETPFNISSTLVTPNSSENARKVYGFLRENFQKRIISGVMTGNMAATLEAQEEIAFIMNSSAGKIPALVGFDFFHGTGLRSDESWFSDYNSSAMAMAEELFNRGGIPTFCWHWKDPNQETESSAFYTEHTNFDLRMAFSDPGTFEVFNVNSDEYQNIMRDIDIVAGYLKTLADKGIPVLWRPLHEAAGRWFWWGAHGPMPNRSLWRLMFDRMVDHHGLDNLIWVWTCEEGAEALEWYPGDEYVDIVVRDFYYWPDEKNHGSLISSFQNLKGIYEGRKLIGLGENGSIPYPENLIADGAGWSFFMPWYGEHTRPVSGRFVHNNADDWNRVMNHEYVITLTDMPGWAGYTSISRDIARRAAPHSFSVRARRGSIELNIRGADAQTVELFNLRGVKIATLSNSRLSEGTHRFSVRGVARQMAFVRVTATDRSIITLPIRIE
jgi:mannan endo-1,4-beta-mannosidase